MYLKSIEIQGFKSFANKTVLDFNEGITGIVGPNGSGKSNISDAVKWVLGEQKIKQLRGSSMQDVIFAGTQKRKPQGFAYVAIVLDNSDRKLNLDYDEVKISRRLYRSGESEYLLNGTLCRLKDINELFYDTGIGKDGYSIIGQGQIDKILSGKADERRDLFDEAVGIVKFKRRKILAMRKLEKEDQNLVRLKDILKELERQVGPLKKQADEAKEYLEIRDRLIVYDSNLFIREIKESIENLEKVCENESIITADLEKIHNKSSDLMKEYDEMEEGIKEIELSLSDKNLELTRGRSVIEGLSLQINSLNEEIVREKNNRVHYSGRIENLKSREFKLISDIEDNLSIIKWIKEQLIFITENKTSDFTNPLFTKTLDLIDQSVKDTMDIVYSCMGKNYMLEEKMVSPRDYGSVSGRPEFLTEIDEKRLSLEKIKEEINEIRESITLKSTELRDLNESFSESSNEINRNLRDFERVRNKLESLKNIAERYEGFGYAVKKVMDIRDENPGICGLVADIIRVPSKYETAIEISLGGAVQNIVTKDEISAKKMLSYLKKNRYGRATFLPLSNIRAKEDKRLYEASLEEGAIGIASELIECDEIYENLSRFLLGRTVIVDNIDNALKIAAKYKQSIRIVTLDGELLNPGGAITGGAYKNSSNLIGRRRELKELEKQCEKYRKIKEKLEIENRNYKLSGEKLYDEIENDKAVLAELQIKENSEIMGISSKIELEYSSLKTRTDFTMENLVRLKDELIDVFEEKSELEESESGSDQRLLEKDEDIKKLSSLMHNAKLGNEKLSILIKEDEDKRLSLENKQKEFFHLKDEISEDIIGLEREAARIENLKEKLDNKIDSISSYMLEKYSLTYKTALKHYNEEMNDRKKLREEIRALKKDIKGLSYINVSAIEEYKEVSTRYEFLKSQYDDLIESEKKLEKVIKDLDEGMRKQFRENFKLISEKFNVIFKELFGGGSGRLELDTDGDILNAGINVIAEPPGKKLQNMMQLSGGEKALTAISLLFAFQSLKPSPFCLLDEIEAALDDSNVTRFAQYLHKLTDQTQFIVITHRRGTMENADRLYGITMQEKGVSALVSVDLVADELDG